MKILNPILRIAALLLFMVTTQAQERDIPKLTGPYLGQKPPGKTPEPFTPDIFKSNWDLFGFHSVIIFSPDGGEAYWQGGRLSPNDPMGIRVSKIENEIWTSAQLAPFSKNNNGDDCPFISPDGRKIFFLSNRQMTEEDQPESEPKPSRSMMNSQNENLLREKREKIWVSERMGNSWSEPKPLPPSINSLSKHWQISVDRKGNLYFGVWKVDPISGGTIEHDIYCSGYEDGQYHKPEKLGPEINEPGSRQYSPYISSDGSYIIFSRVAPTSKPIRPILYISYRNYEGEWTKSIALDNIVRFDKSMSNATVTHDGKYMFFLSNNGKEVYWVDAGFIEELRKKELHED